ncbi:hypothetical protein BX600DRAFT_507502 [Xylariales sp. PMI_506]|nr:hypothetical protein BX600DRAFT_507502 [Xylariales sp. PMI_506]
MLATSTIIRTYISLAFLAFISITGIVVVALYGSSPCRLLVTESSKNEQLSRLILVAEQMNSNSWTAFYGESVIINSLINRPLKPSGPVAMTLAAAATKDWNSYFICFWIAVCIFVQAYVITANRAAEDWMKSCAGISRERYRTELSSRGALQNTIMALNPDTFPTVSKSGQKDLTYACADALRWINPILEPGLERTRWEIASLNALKEAQDHHDSGSGSSSPVSEYRLGTGTRQGLLAAVYFRRHRTGEKN